MSSLANNLRMINNRRLELVSASFDFLGILQERKLSGTFEIKK